MKTSLAHFQSWFSDAAFARAFFSCGGALWFLARNVDESMQRRSA